MTPLWIRTQDRTTLRICENMEISKLDNGDMQRHGITEIKNNFKYTLGIYLTQARAIEVLNEIQKFIELDDTAVFEMPKE